MHGSPGKLPKSRLCFGGDGAFASNARPIIVFVAAVITTAVASLVSVPGFIGFLGAGLAIVMMTIAAIDWRRFLIPDWLNAVGFGLAVINAALQAPGSEITAIVSVTLRGAAVALLFFAIRYGYVITRGHHGLGLGDVKLAGVAGAWLDWLVIPIAIELAAFSALTAYLLQHIVLASSISPTKRLPFGTFFAPAIWISWLFEARLFG